MNEIQVFHYNSNEVRTVQKSGEPWFVLKDVCQVLGISHVKNTADRLDQDEVGQTEVIDSLGRKQTATIINESGLYNVILRSDKPEAKPFRKWVTSEVLPSIRKNGGYIADQENLTPEQILAKAVLLARNVIEEKDRQLETMRPKALFADAVSTSRNSILVGDMAKLLKQNGVEIGQKRLFGWLRDHGYLVKQKGASWNMPTQRSMEAGLFEIKETAVSHSDGSITVSKTTKITGKGQVFFVNKFMAEGAIREQPKNSTQDVR